MWIEVNDVEFGASSRGAFDPMSPIDAHEMPDGLTILLWEIRRTLSFVGIYKIESWEGLTLRNMTIGGES